MWLLLICYKEAREVDKRVANGSCPYCEGKVVAIDIESKWKLCCLPVSYVNKRKYTCTLCSRRLVLYDSR
ncbi:hypothetical protein R6Q59_006502 [Mikania micrantha]